MQTSALAYAPEAVETPPGANHQQPQNEGVLQLERIAGEGIDLAFLLPDDMLAKIASQCVEAYERDKADREEWEKDYDTTEAMLGGDREAKSFPWPNASNVVYPLIATATLQFGARAYPAIVKGQDVAKTRVIGKDPDGSKVARGNRIKDHMNWQLLEDMPEWEEETDKLVHMLPWQGCVFRQVIWDANYARPQTSLVSAKCLVVTQAAKDLETVPIFCKEFTLFPHEITERMRDGRYTETDIKFTEEDEKQGEQKMLECHCRYDLDEDDYSEPYIAVIHKDTGKLLSLKAGFWPKGVERKKTPIDLMLNRPGTGRVIRVRRHVEFIKYDFIPDFEGGFLGIGFGFLLREHNQIINTIINQLLDAATDQNAGGGFIGKGVSLKGGSLYFDPGEWKQINHSGSDLRSEIVPRPTSEPSPTLFQLLGLMIEAGKELASIRDALSGEAPANQPATTTLALIEQGLQVFSSIYKRIYRALGKELKLIFQLNAAYLPDEQYFYVLDDQKAIAREDYNMGDHDVVPVADPSTTTSAQRLGKAQFLESFKGDPDIDQRELKRRLFSAAEIEDIDKLMPEKTPEQQQAQAEQGDLMKRSVEAKVAKDETAAVSNVAKAEKDQAQADQIKQDNALRPAEFAMDALDRHVSARTNGQPATDQGGMGAMGGMAGAAADPALAGGVQGPVGGIGGILEAPDVLQPAGPQYGPPPGAEVPLDGVLGPEPDGQAGNPFGPPGT